MARLRTEEEVDALIQEMINKNKGKYITQGVTFNKNSESQMKLLKMALMSSYSFSAWIKELITEKFISDEKPVTQQPITQQPVIENSFKEFKRHDEEVLNDLKQFERVEKPASRNIGNFI